LQRRSFVTTQFIRALSRRYPESVGKAVCVIFPRPKARHSCVNEVVGECASNTTLSPSPGGWKS